MLETPHVVVGAVIATKIPNPALSLPLAFVSHFVLEKVPHWNPHLNTEKQKFGKVTRNSTKVVIIDVFCSLLIGTYVASRVLSNYSHFITILVACFIAALPDIVEGPYYFFDFESKLLQRWITFQKSLQLDAPVLPGLLTQLVTVIFAFWWIFS